MTNEEELEVEEFPLPLQLAFIQYDEELSPLKNSIDYWMRSRFCQAPHGGCDKRLF